ncbi:CidA/LrgA family protein [Saccharospirillum impatiens]|uniref:CidA/LrgA family protein n=1 Tax=Saccharospirillum impatiens TaxID=169438 RepID=UPI0004113AE5|nr:CidA/LrgA family protein [Saccharospirillum impatiens]
MVLGFLVLLVYWLAGEALSQWIGWPIPGNVVGLVLLWITLTLLKKVPQPVAEASKMLIRYLTLLFVPAGVGLIEHWDRLMANGHWMLLIIAISTVLAALAMIATFKLFRVNAS